MYESGVIAILNFILSGFEDIFELQRIHLVEVKTALFHD